MKRIMKFKWLLIGLINFSFIYASPITTNFNIRNPYQESKADLNKINQIRSDLKVQLSKMDHRHFINFEREFHIDPNSNQISFLWLDKNQFQKFPTPVKSSIKYRQQLEQVAKSILMKIAPFYHFQTKDLSSIHIQRIHDTGKNAIVINLQQKFDQITFTSNKMSLIMNRYLQPVATSGGFLNQPPNSHFFEKNHPQQLQNISQNLLKKALQDISSQSISKSTWKKSVSLIPPQKFQDADLTKISSKFQSWNVPQNILSDSKIYLGSTPRTSMQWQMYHHAAVPALVIELSVARNGSTTSELWQYTYNMENGQLLQRKSLTRNIAKSYRVWADSSDHLPYPGPQGNDFFPHPTGQDDDTQLTLAPTQLITLDSFNYSRNDPWLTSTTTQGNNVSAYVDRDVPDGLSFNTADHVASESSTDTFDYSYNFSMDPNTDQNLQNAAIVQAFYISNFMHDFMYDSGFNEKAGNGQVNNYGRGGQQGDPVLVEIQDYEDRNNANMSTPSDGSSAKMQVFLWDGLTQHEVDINSPSNFAGMLTTGAAAFGPRDFDVTADLVLVDDGVVDPNEADATIHDGCETPFVNAADIAGKIAVIDRGACFFVVKISQAEAAGASAVIIINQKPDGVITMGAGDNPPVITIPSLMVSKTDGDPIRDALINGTVINARMIRTTDVDRDGGLDNSLVIHEWGHFLNNRLLTISSNQAQGMDEGWADFLALLTLTRAEDEPLIDGAFAVTAYANNNRNSAYFGIRRAPYSVDMNINALTFKHIADGNALPTTMPVAFGSDGSDNSEVHATGEVWASMLWEGYVGLIKSPNHSFSEAQNLMKNYLVASLNATPVDPDFIEARDALLAVVGASSTTDAQIFLDGFAKRGLGIGAVAPQKTSDTNANPIESFNNVNPTPPPPPSQSGGGGSINWIMLLLVFYGRLFWFKTSKNN